MTTTPDDVLGQASPEALIELHDLFGRVQCDAARLRESIELLHQGPLSRSIGLGGVEFADTLGALEHSAIDVRTRLGRLIPKVVVNGRNRQIQRIEDTLTELVEQLGRSDEREADAA